MLSACLYIALLGLAANFVGCALPRGRFRWDRAPYRALRWEKQGQVYEALRIRRWKDRLPDASLINRRVLRKRLRAGRTEAELRALLSEMCVSECVHWCLCPLSLPVLWLAGGLAGVALFLACVVGNLPFVCIQRYNRPRIERILKRLTRPD